MIIARGRWSGKDPNPQQIPRQEGRNERVSEAFHRGVMHPYGQDFAALERRYMQALSRAHYQVLAWHDTRAFCCHWVSGALVRLYNVCSMQEDGAEFTAIRWVS